jgi:hypothetical protein
MSTDTSTKSLAGGWLRNPGAQLLGFLGANMTVGSLVALVVPLLVERHGGATWNPVLAAWQSADALPGVVLTLTVLAFVVGPVLMALAVRSIRTSRR